MKIENYTIAQNILSMRNTLKRVVNSLVLRKIGLGILFGILTIMTANAQRTASVSGNWSSTSTWGGSAVPTSSDAITINSGITVTVDATANCASLTFLSAATIASNVNINSGITLNVAAAINLVRASSGGMNTVAVGAGVLNAGSVAFTSGGGTNRHQITISTGTVTVSGDITQAGSSGSATIAFTGAGILNVSGAVLTTSTGTLTTFAGSTVNYNGGVQTIWNIANYLGNLTLSGSGVKTFAAATTINGGLSISGTAVANLGGFTSTTSTLTLGISNQAINTSYGGTGSGASVINPTYFGATSGILNVGSVCTTGTWTGTTSTDWNTASNWCGGVPTTSTNVVIPDVTNKPTIGTAGGLCNNITINLNATLTISSTGTLSVSGAITRDGTITLSTGSTVNYAKVGNQTVLDMAYYNLTLSGTGTKTQTLGNSRTFSGKLVVGSGANYTTSGNKTLKISGTTDITGTLTLGGTSSKTFTGNVTINANGIWNETGNASYTFAGNLSNNGTTFTANSGVHTFSGTAKTISGSGIISIPSTTITGTYTNSGTLTVSTLLTVTAVTLTNNGTITATTALSGTGGVTQGSTGILNIGGTSAITTLSANAVGNTVNYNTAGNQTAKVSTYYNLTLSGSNTKTFATTPTVNGILSMEGTATVAVTTGVVTYGTAATLKYNTTNVRTATSEEWITPFSATGGVIIAGTLAITLNAAKVFNQAIPLTINSGATLNTSSSNFQLTLGGNFIKNGTFTANASPIVIGAGTATQSIAGFTTTGAVSMTKTGGTATLTGNVSGGAFILNGSGGTLDLGAGLVHTFSGAWTRTNGTLLGKSSTLNIAGTVTNTAGTFTPGTSTVNYNGAGQTIANVNYFNISLSGSGTKVFPAAITISEELSFGGTAKADLGTFTSSTNSLTFGGVFQASGSWGSTASTATNKDVINTHFGTTATGILNVTASCIAGTWSGATSTDWNTGSNWCNSVVPTSSTNVTIPSGGNQPIIGAAGGVCNNIILNSGATLTITGSNTLTVSGDWTNNGGTFTANTGSVIFNNTTADQNILGSIASQSFYNLTVSKSTFKLILDKPVTVGGTLTMTSGHIDASSNTLELGTSTAATGTLNYTSGNILGNFKRWINAPGALLFPVGTASASNMALVTFTDLTAGSLTAFFTATDPGWNNTAVLTENSVIIDHQFPEGYWTMTAANSLASTDYSLSLTGDGFATYTEDNTVRIMQRASSGLGWALPGTHNLSAYVTPTAQRSGLAVFGEFAHGALRTCSLSASVAKTNTTCGSNDGTITVSSPSGATNYEYRINAEIWQADGNFTGLAAGTYSVQMRDADATGCTVVLGNQVVSQPAVLTLTASVTDESCSSNGAINITAGGGATPYTYDWADLPGTNNAEDRTGVLAGTYTVTFTDANGCTFTSDNIVVASPVGICDGVDVCKSDAAKVFSVTPDPEVITYTWTVPATAVIVSGQNTSSITVDWTAVAVGAYQVSVRSVNTCSESAETLLTIYVKNPAASAQVIGALCVGSNVQLSASGGQSYAWTGPNGFTSSSANPVIYNATASDNGIYSVIVTDQKGCSANASVTITLNTPPTETSIISPSACGASTGGINISPSGGSSFTYLWNNGATTQDISSIPAGNYSVVITNNLGCSIVGNYTVGNTGGPTASVAQTNVLCNGSSTGDITLTVSGGTPGVDPEPLYTYLWSNGSVDQDLSGLAAGTYSVIITDGAGCTGAASAIITQPNALQLDKVLTEVKCFGASTGAINITVTGGTGPYSYDWGGGITSDDRSAIPAGNYSVTVTDASSCTVTGSFTITQPALVLSAGTVVANISCNGSANGLVNLTVSGGTAPYTYLWTRTESGYAGATTEDIAALSPGTYHVTITDANNCSTTSSGIITEPDLLSLSKTQTNVSCKSGSNGTVNLTVSGGTAPYTFAWSNGAITEDLSALAAGTYSVIVTDAHACSATTSATITEPAAVLGATITGQANVLCHAGTTGAATATVSGGTSPYTYAWNTAPVQTAATATGLIAGLYSVVVTDANLCTTTKSVTITQPSAISISGSVTNVLCYSGTSGSINITASGGTGSYTYNWGGGITTEDRTSLSAGTYTVTVTDASSCNSAATSFTITQPSAAITPTMVNTNITCKNAHNGSINLSVTGGVSPYTYLWTGGATTEDLTNLNPGTYSVTVTDANLCIATLSSSAITEPAAVLSVVATPTAVTCKDGSNGSISASPGGGTAPYTYSWSTGATTSSIGSLKAGVYNLTVTDHNGCTATTSAEVTQPSTQIELFAARIESSSCGLGTGSIDLSVVNGIEPFTYAWTRTAVGYAGAATQDIDGLSSGVYHVTVTDATGCSSTLSETIGTAPALSVSITSYPRTCISIDGSAYAIVTGGVSPYTYLWTNGATTQEINNLVAGDYSVTVTDANGCTATNTGTVSSISCVEPIALTDILNTNYNTLLSGTVATNDSDPDGESSTLQFFNETLPTEAQGILSWGTDYDGLFTFTPTIGFAGTFTLAYKVFDLTGLSTSGIISITVGPNAVNDPIGTNLNTPVSGNVTTNDVYEAGSSFTRLTSPAKGICTFNADGTFTYTPNTGEVGDDSFTYSVCLPEPNTSVCSTGTVLISIDGQADIQLSKTVDDATPNVGSHVIFTLTATNNGPNLAMGVSVSDVLPSGYTFVSDDGGSATNEASGTVTWTVGSLANAATATLHVTALVNPTGSYNNTATITGSNTDPSPDNNSASRSTVPVPQADLSISKTANNPSQSVGQPIIFTLTVTNNGPSAASGVSVTDILPSGYTYVSDNGASAYNSATGVWTIGTLNNSGTATLNIVATVLASGTYTNTATITSSTVDPTPGNNSSTLTPIPGAVADLSIVKTVNNSSPYVGSYIEFTLTVTNNGPSTSTGVVVTDALPTGYTYTSDDGSTASTELAGTVSWTVGNLANAATATLKITAKVNASGIYTNTATVGTSDQPDNNSSNNSSSVLPTSIVPQSDLAITKTVDNESPLMGNNVVFTLTVTNNGLSQASGVSVTDVLPSGYTYISNTAPSAGSFVAGTGVWTIGSLANSATATLAITAQVKSSGDYINSATVSATTADLTAWNNSSAKTINPNPIVIISNPAAVCSPSTVNLSLAAVTTGSTSGLTYTYWRDAAATIPYATPTAATAGTWYIKGTTSSGGYTIESVTVTVNTLPTALSLAGSIICVSPGGTGTITSTTSTSGVSYQLYNASNVSVQVAKTGTGAGLTWSGLPAANGYYAVATNSATCNTVSNTVDVTTYANPTITTSGSVTTVCYSAGVQSTTLAYSATTNSPTSFSIDWDVTANSAGLTDQGNTAFAFASGSGTLTGISVPAGTSAGGPYSGTMTILNANGCTNTHEVTLSVNALPVTSAISGNTSPICSATGISYSVTLSSGSSYAWTVPVGATITAGTTGPNNNQITVDFGSVDGDVTVVETNAANCSGNAKTLTISMSGCSEDADFSGTPLILCQNETVTFTNSSTNTTGSTSYSWDFGAGSSPATANTAGPHTVTYSTGGLKTVSLIITDGASNTETKTDYVTVNALPATPTITAGGPTTFCTGGSLTLTASAGTSYLWSNSETTASISVSTAGSYSVQVTNASGCLSDASLVTAVTVNTLSATPTITAGGPTTFCTGGSVTLTASAGTSYLWSTAETTQSISVSTAGNYSVQVTNVNGCQSAASSATVVTVNALPTTPTISAGGPTTFCTGGSVTLTASAGTSYLWSTSETTQSISVSTAGNYSVQVTNVNGCQSAASSATVVTVNALPTTPTISAGGPTTFCTGGSVTLTASTGTSYLWSNSETTASINVTSAGNYSVQVTNASGCLSAASAATVVTVNALPATPTISAGGSTTFCTGGSVTLTASAGTSYLWSTSETTQSISVSTAGNYSVQVTNVSACQSAASAATVVTVNTCAGFIIAESGGSTGTSEAATSDAFNVVLNAQPASDVVISVTSGDLTEGTLTVITLTFTPANWNTPQTVTVTGVDDNIIDGNITYNITLSVVDASSDNNFDTLADQTLSVTNTENDLPGFTNAESGGSTGTSEAATSDAFTVVLNAQPASDVVISVTSGDLSEGTLTVITLTFTPANWNTPQTVTVTGVDDNIIDGNITYNITLSVVDASSDNNFDTLADQTVSVTNTDNDSPGFTIAESGGSTGTSEAATSDAFNVVLNAQPASDVVISLTSGDLTEGTLSVTTLTFTPANWNSPQTVTVTGVDDNIIDGNITYNITLSVVDASSDNNFDTLADQTLSVTNTENDLPGFTIAESGGSTGTSEAATSDALTVVLNAQPASDVVISVTSGDLSEGTLTVITLTFTPANWNIPQTVTVTGVDDNIIDGNINYQITLSVVDASSDNNFDTLADQTVSVTNTDNDLPGFTIAESGGSTGTSEAATSDAFTVVLNAQPASDVVISLTSGDLTEGTLSVTTLTFTPANWNSPQTVTVTGVDDNIIDGNINYQITLSVVDASSDNNFDTLADQTVSVTNTDNDSPGFTIAESGGSTGTSEAATSDALTVVLNAQPASDVVISVTSGDLTEGTLTVITLTFTPANWNTPQTVTVTGVDDNIIDGNITYNITLSVVDASSDNNFDTLADQTVSVTNTDNIAPTAVNDTKSTNEDVSVTINVTANDTDSDGIINVSTVDLDPATAGIQNSFTVAFEGTYTVNNSGVVTFTSVANFNGTATAINYTVKDNSDATSNIATLRITVTLVNDSPMASSLHVISPEDTPVNGTVASNFSDVDGDYLIVTEFVIEGNTYSAGTSVVIPNKGTLVIEQNGTFKFIPAQNFNGILPTISFTISDGNGGTGIGELFISIESVNDSPVMVDENLTVCSSNVLTGNILSNGDTDPDGTILTVNTTPVSGPAHGTFSIASGGAFIYTPEEGYNGPDQITLSVCDNGIPLPKACSTDVIHINVIHAVLVNAGTDATICEGSTFIPNASTVSNATSLIWTTSGTGTFSDASAIHPVYTPDAGDRTSGSVILTLTANSESTCLPVSDAMILSITHQATVNAGENATICEGSAYSLNASTVSNATSLIWTTSGAGTFSDASAIHPEYTPGASDRTLGSVILTLMANSKSPCLPVSDAMILSITHQATADAGTDAAICEGSAYSLNASAVSNASSLIWTTSGTGTFSDASAIHPEYTPGAGDRTSGSVILTLTANSENPCLPVSDAMILSITHQATAIAGENATICEGSAFSLTSAVVSNVTSQIWSTSGTGLFSNIHLVNPSYSPSSADISAGSVSLTLSAEGGSPCANASDAMVLFISHQVKVDAGENATWSEGLAYQMNAASVSDATSVIWTTSGNGTFNDASVINPTYTASAADILQGSVILKLTAIAEGPCSAASDDMVLTLTTKLIVNAGPDVVLFGNSPFVLSAAFITNSTNGIWRTSGSGTFNNRSLINTTYIPSDADLRMGQVILTLTSGNLEDTIILTFSTKPAVSAGPDREACAGEYITINGATADYYSEIHWTSSGLGEISGSNTLSPVYKPALNETGDVTLIAAVSGLGSSSSQKSTDSMIIKYHEQMIVDAGASDTILLNTRAVLSASVYPETGNYTYSWSPAELVQNSTSNQTETIDLSSTIELVLTVTDVATGCQAKDSVRIVIENNIDNLLDIRNGISPNGDGDNDIWWIDGIEKFPDNEIIIFNRWGDKIIELRNYDNNKVAWDGKNKQGHLVTDGTYYYLIKINGIKTYTGWINLRSGSN